MALRLVTLRSLDAASALARICSPCTFARLSACAVKVDLGDQPLVIEAGRLARLADGCAVVRLGNTSVMVTAVSKASASSPAPSFVPLTVNFQNKAAAVGRIPSNFLRREIGLSDAEILTARLIDRSIRPFFPKENTSDCQVMCNLLAVDGVNDPDVLCINAASAALSLSDIPWKGPIGAVRVGYRNGACLLNPTRKQMQESEVNLVLAASTGGQVAMLEMSGNEVPRAVLVSCIDRGLEAVRQITDCIERMRSEHGKTKRPMNVVLSPSQALMQHVTEFAGTALADVINHHSLDKLTFDQRINTVREETVIAVQKSFPDASVPQIVELFNTVFRNKFRQLLFETGCRYDGRKLDDLRPIECHVDLFRPLHGSALFQRGQTQVMCTVTFDSLEAAFHSDAVSVLTGFAKEKRFMLHYAFPPYCNNEISTPRAAGRRELGHGALAEKALRPVVPTDFPFTIRVTAEVLESNGSSSMASVCGGSLALMDSGVPIRCPVAGVAIGLFSHMQDEASDAVSDYRLLTDITGLEDYLGDMDFKMASTDKGFTAIQLDTKVAGVSPFIIGEALERGGGACRRILHIMSECLAQPRPQLKANGPAEEKFTVPLSKRARFVGPGGYNLRKIQSETGAQVSQIDECTYSVFATSQSSMNEAKEMIERYLQDNVEDKLEFGGIYTATIVELRGNGVMVTLHPSMTPVLLPNSQLDMRRIDHPSVLSLKVGQEISVKYFGRDPSTGNIRLSRKVLQKIGTDSAKQHLPQAASSPWISKSAQ